MKIDVSNASIKTATVEIHALTVSGKQVTLAVFRQLVEEPLLTADSDLRGPAWGTVNYHPDGCKNDGEHIHVVWQLGSDLRRAKVAPPAPLGRYFFAGDSGQAWLSAALGAGWRPRVDYDPKPFMHGRIMEAPSLFLSNGTGRTVEIIPHRDHAEFLWGALCPGGGVGQRACERDDEHDRHWPSDRMFTPNVFTPDEIWREIVAEDKAEQAAWQKRQDQWEALASLPQLFIAV